MIIAIIIERLVFAAYAYYVGKRYDNAIGYFFTIVLLGPAIGRIVLAASKPKLEKGESLEEEDLEILDPEEYARRQAAKEEPESDE